MLLSFSAVGSPITGFDGAGGGVGVAVPVLPVPEPLSPVDGLEGAPPHFLLELYQK
ncbi:hypothetical protein Q7363_08520 [Glaesserella parasuis]|nr:hypothetical protein [Glaesserella parasuis]MDP0105374.1 hypothetical protein [Glaesserella parasuis]